MGIASVIAFFALPGQLGNVLSLLFGTGSLVASLAAGTTFEYYRGVALYTRRGFTNGTPVVSATKTDVHYAAAVSYTHLDVYKRQPIHRTYANVSGWPCGRR